MQSGTRRTHAAVQHADALAGTLGDTVKSFDDIAQRAQQIARGGPAAEPRDAGNQRAGRPSPYRQRGGPK